MAPFMKMIIVFADIRKDNYLITAREYPSIINYIRTKVFEVEIQGLSQYQDRIDTFNFYSLIVRQIKKSNNINFIVHLLFLAC